MIDTATVDRVIASLQELRANYDDFAAFEAKHSKVKAEYDKLKAEHDTIAKQLAQLRREYEELNLQYQSKRQRVPQLDADIERRNGELARITSAIAQAKQAAFGV